MTILETIAEYTRERVELAKENRCIDDVKAAAMAMADAQLSGQAECSITGLRFAENGKFVFPFEKALREGDITFICECKKASPSKGVIEPNFHPVDIAKDYEAAGAGAISVLTEPKWFLGSDEYLRNITKTVKIPCLRKDFTVDEFMIYEAKLLGSSAVLLICSITEEVKLQEYIKIADSLGLSALVEAHDEDEIAMAIRAGARIIGVNNRNLKDFTVDIHNSERLRNLVPKDILFVAESGIKTASDIEVLRQAGVNAVLIGETLMRAPDKKQMLDELRG